MEDGTLAGAAEENISNIGKVLCEYEQIQEITGFPQLKKNKKTGSVVMKKLSMYSSMGCLCFELVIKPDASEMST